MIPVLIGLGVLIGGAILVATWDDIVDWLSDMVPKIRMAWQAASRYASPNIKILGDIIVEDACQVAEFICQFRNTDNKLVEEVRKVDIDEVPPSILEKLGKQRQDITKPMALVLEQDI